MHVGSILDTTPMTCAYGNRIKEAQQHNISPLPKTSYSFSPLPPQFPFPRDKLPRADETNQYIICLSAHGWRGRGRLFVPDGWGECLNGFPA